MTAQVTSDQLVQVGGLVVAALVLLTGVLGAVAKGLWTLAKAIRERLDEQDARLVSQGKSIIALEGIAQQMKEMLNFHNSVIQEFVKVRSAREMATEMLGDILRAEKEVHEAPAQPHMPRIPRKVDGA